MEITSAGWSAIAAMLSAVTAFLMWQTAQSSFRFSARPELVIADWGRSASADKLSEKITFSAIENVGNGSALHVHMNSFSLADDDRPMTAMSTIRASLISPKVAEKVEGEITIYWNNVAGKPNSKSVSLNIEIHCWDTTGVRYQTNYNLLAVQLGGNNHVADEVCSGVMLGSRIVRAESVWLLNVRRQFVRIPLLGRLLKKD